MKKKAIVKKNLWRRDFFTEFLRKMRLTIYLFFLGMITVSAASYSQNPKLTLQLNDVSLKQLLENIQLKSDYCFLYNVEQVDLDRLVSVDKKEESIKRVLDEALLKTGLTYEILNNQVFLFPEKESQISTVKPSMIENEGVTIHGVVLDENNVPLPGATVVEEGTTNGVITDMDGIYEIEVSGTEAVLTFSFIGYLSKKVPVKNKRVLNIVLEPDVSELEEVVVVGFGEQKRASVIGSMSSISVNELKAPTRSITNNLAGQLAGVIAVQRSGEPGYDDADFWIRGVSTFQGATSPLILVDGVERSIGNLDPEEIESFSILKDATATAVYGVRGANGVILISTKGGKTGPVQVKFRAEAGFSEPTKLPDFVDGARYMELYNEALVASGNPTVFSEEKIQMTRDGVDPDLNPSVNWLDEVTEDVASNQRYNLSLSGGGPKVRYFLTGAYYHETGIFKEDKSLDYNTNINLRRYNFRSDVVIDATKSTRVRLNIGGYLSDRNAPGTSTQDILDMSLRLSPIEFPARYSDGTLARSAGGDPNPYTQSTQRGYKQEWKNALQTMLNIEQKLDFITEGLKAEAKFSFDTYNYNSINRTKTPDQFYATGRDEEGNLEFLRTVEGQPFLGFSKTLAGNRAVYVETSLMYNRSIKLHRIGGLLLYNQREYLNTSAGNALASLPYRNQGLAGRVTYSYDDRYFGEVNFGYNGSENFASGKRFGFFPSAALGWMVSNEAFMEPLKKVVHKLKFKGSYGLVGNDQIGGRRFAYITTINTSAGGYRYGLSGSYYNWGGNAEGQFGNPDLSWETVEKMNIGVELGLFNKLDIQADYFSDYRSDIFIERTSLPSTSGYVNSPWANFGEMSNKGFDISTTFNHSFTKDIQVSLRGNFTYASNTIEEMDEPDRMYDYQMRTGKRDGQQFGLLADGLFSEEDFLDVENSILLEDLPEHTFGPVRPGDIKYKDVNNDGKVDTYDQVPIGKSTIPEITYGFGLNLVYKGFNIGLFFQGIGNSTRILSGTNFYPFNDGLRGSIYSSIENRWTPENPSENVTWPRLYAGTNSNNYQSSTWWLRDASFMRLKNAEIGYQLPTSLLQKYNLKSVRLFARGTNLYTWSKEIKMWDPEIGSNDGMIYPPSKVISLGIEISM